MDDPFLRRGLGLLLVAALAGSGPFAAAAAPREQGAAPGRPAHREGEPTSRAAPAGLDRSGHKRVGTASVYAQRFAGRKMADGARMSLGDDNAASKTLPLGTEARVTNLKTGRSATVTIQDRGPYAKGRIVDLSPATAAAIGLTPKEGVAKVEVAPIALPPAAASSGVQ